MWSLADLVWLQPRADAGSSFADFSTLKMEAKRWFTQDLHVATSQKTSFFIVTAVETSNLKDLICLLFVPFGIGHYQGRS
jgi:hypothetical protein